MESQSGNAFFLILIGVALFGALSYTVSSTNRTSGNSISKEKARANAAQIIQLATAMRININRIKSVNGCTDSTLDLSNTVYTRINGSLLNAGNATAPADESCHVFSSKGGNVLPVYPVASALDLDHPDLVSPTAWRAGAMTFNVGQMLGVGSDGPAGTESANDLYIRQVYLTKDTCIAVNDIMGVTNPGGNPPPIVETGSLGGYADGSLVASKIIGDASTSGIHGYCVFKSPYYSLYFSILDR